MALPVSRLLVVSSGAVVLLAVGVALAWTQRAPIDVTVHKHHFHKIKAATEGCVVKTALYFVAPQEGYKSRARNRNHFRFRARIQLSEERELVSPVFFNRAPGRRVYRFEHDTSGDGCWAEKEHKIYRVDVDGCRSRACQIQAFR